jgi:WXXGXW repeat (2 copies)
MPHFSRAGVIAAAALCLVVTGCSAPGVDPPARTAATVAPYPPPPKRAEIPPPSPSATDVLWLEGHWSWDGAKYVWTSGHYVQRPTPTANWLPGFWDRDADGWLWTEGHWDS